MKRKNFSLRKFLALFLAAVCLAGALPAAVRAENHPYTYKLRLFSGAQGTVNSLDMIAWGELSYGYQVIFRQNRIQILNGQELVLSQDIDITLNNNSKYYIKGIRKSGRDNNEAESVSYASFLITEDMDYVITYGLKSDSVAYTVKFVDTNGNELAPSETYYGNVGDRPVVAYLYIEGFQPQAYNLTGTLKSSAAENIFTFVYSPIPAGTEGGSSTITTITDIVSGQNQADAEGTGGNFSEGTADVNEFPMDIINIDDPEVPLSAGGGNADSKKGTNPKDFAVLMSLIALPTSIKFSICSLSLLFLGLIAYFLFFRKKEERDENVSYK